MKFKKINGSWNPPMTRSHGILNRKFKTQRAERDSWEDIRY